MGRRPKDWKPEFEHITGVFPKRLEEMMGKTTLTQLSLLSGVSLVTLINWKHGRTVPDLCLLFRVCTILDASIDWIVGLDEIANGKDELVIEDKQSVLSHTQSNVYDIQPIEEDET